MLCKAGYIAHVAIRAVTVTTLTCRQLQGLWTLRHDQIQSKVQFGAAAAGHSSSIEPPERHLKNLAFGDPGCGKRGDVAVSTVDDLLNIDVPFVHPASSSMRSRASREPGITAREAEKKKRRDHGVGAVGHTFVPFAIETYGHLGVEAIKVLKEWAKTAGEVADAGPVGVCVHVILRCKETWLLGMQRRTETGAGNLEVHTNNGI